MSVRLPGILSSSLAEVGRLNPTAGSLTMKMVGTSEAAMTIPEGSPAVNIHDWVSIYTGRGLAGIFRICNVAENLKKQIDLTMLHGRDILSDSVWAAQTDFSGTKTQFLTQLLAQQTQLINGVKPWALGTCEDSATIEKSINYDRLSTLLESMEEEGSGYYFVYDQTTWPWTISYVAKPQNIASEFRLSRNIRSASITYNDADMCTRLYLSVSSKSEETETVKKKNPDFISHLATPNVSALIDENITVSSTDSAVRIYNNAAAQAEWGIIVKTADVDTHDDIVNQHFESADAWAANFMSTRAEPSVQIQIDGDVLGTMTGETWDEADIAALCQVALPDYGHTFRERVISIAYPELFRDEKHVSVSLANVLPKFSESIAQARKEATSAARHSRATARTAADAKELTTWSQHVVYQGEALDGTGVLTLYESGIDMDATGGVRIFSLTEGLQALYSEIVVNSEAIKAKIGSDALNGYLEITQLATEIGNVMVTADGKTIVSSIVTTINDDQGTIYLNSDHVKLKDGSIITASTLDARLADIDNLISNTIIANTYMSAQTGRFSNLWVESPGQNGATNMAKVNNAINSITSYTPAEEGKIGFQYTTLANPTPQSVNFNIADTAYFKSHVGIDAANLTMTEIGQTPYNASTAAEITGITAGTSDKYFLIAASPKVGDTVYKKFVLPAASAPPVVASIDDITGTTLAANQIADTNITITASGTNVSAYSESVALEESTYQVGSVTRPCVVLKVDGSVVGRIYTQNAYQAGESAGAASAAGSITNLSGTAIASNQIMDTAIPITASGTNVSSYSENVSMEESTYQVGSVTRPCVVLKVDGSVVGRIYTQNAYQAGQSAGSSAAAGSITNLSGTAIATNQIKDTAIPITASGTNVSDYSENVAMEESTYQVGNVTRPCVVLKVDGTVVGRIYTENAYQAGQNAGSGSAGSITNLSGTTIATNQIKDTAIPITASGTNVSDYSENVAMEESTYQVGNVTRPCVVLKVDGTVVGRIYTQNAYQAGANSVTPVSASIDSIGLRNNAAGVQYTYQTDQQQYEVYVRASGTNVAQKDGTVYVSGSAAFNDGRDSVTITAVERIASCAFDVDRQTARQDVRFTLSNGNTFVIHENFDAIYRAGLAGTSVDTTIEYAADLSSDGAVFDVVEEDTDGDPLSINVSDIYQRGVTDATPAEKHWYTYCTSGYVTIYVRGSGSSGGSGIGEAIYDLLNRMVASKKIAFYPYTPVEIVGSELGYTKVSYGGSTYFVDPSNLKESEEDLSIGHRIGIKDLTEQVTVVSTTMSLIHTGGYRSSISVYLEPKSDSYKNYTSEYVESSDFSSYRSNANAVDYFNEMAAKSGYYGRHEKTDFASDIQHKAIFDILYSDGNHETIVVAFNSYAKAQDEVIYDKTGYIDANNYVNLRSTASTGGSILIQVPDGAAVMCKYNPNGYSESWMPVQYGGKTGYIQSQFIEGTNAWTALNTKKVSTIKLVGVGHSIGSSKKDFGVIVQTTKDNSSKMAISYAIESGEYASDWRVTNNDIETYLKKVKQGYYLYHSKADCSSTIMMRVKMNVTYTNRTKFPDETVVVSVQSLAT